MMQSSPQDVPSLLRSGLVRPESGLSLRSIRRRFCARNAALTNGGGAVTLAVDRQASRSGLGAERLPALKCPRSRHAINRSRAQARRFAHPAEATVRQAADRFIVSRWDYEPTSFVLRTDRGRATSLNRSRPISISRIIGYYP